MYEYYTPKEFIAWAEKRFDNDLDFTKYLVTYLKVNNKQLFDGVIAELKNGNYKLKYLDLVATS